VVIDRVAHSYRLVIEHHSEEPAKSRIERETLHAGKQLLLNFEKGELHLYDDSSSEGATIPMNASRSALGAIAPGRDNRKLTAFKRWIRESTWYFKPDPEIMSRRTDGFAGSPYPDLANFASWYPMWVSRDLSAALKVQEALRDVLHCFENLQVSKTAPVLQARFAGAGSGPSFSIDFDDLSDGQRQLCALYVLRHAIVQPGRLVIFDEPDNYVALREIQPWLTEVVEEALGPGGPQVWLISHHPELLNQLAPDHGVRFFRDGGPTRIEPFRGVDGLTSSEVVARGWAGD
jgi:predicted ATPase